MTKRVAVVTGSNRGVGFAIVRSLCKQFDGDVFLTARNEELGKAAVKKLQDEGLYPKFHKLDITDHNSIIRLRDFLHENYSGLDVLINNSGVAYKIIFVPSESPSGSLIVTETWDGPFPEQASVTCKVNFFGTLDVCQMLFPLLRPHARVCHVSSGCSSDSFIKCSEEVKKQFIDPALEMDALVSLMNQFVKAAQDGTYKEQGFAGEAYGMSKLGMNAMAVIQQRQLDSSGAEDIIVNVCTPGYVNTEMTSWKGTLTIDEGAETPVYCVLLPSDGENPRGKFICKKNICEWRE